MKKIEKIAEKQKVVRNFLTNLKFFIFFEFFSENVFKTLLRGRETTRKKYRIVFEKFLKYVIFFDFGCPSPITHHPSPIHPSIQVGSRLGPRRDGKIRLHTEGLPHLKENRTNLKKKSTTFRGFGTKRSRLSTFRGFGTERARLGTLKKSQNLVFLLKKSTYKLD